MKKIKKLLLLFILPLLLISCDRKPVLSYKDACAHPDALKEIKYYVKNKIADADGLIIAAEMNSNEKIVKELLKSKNIEDNDRLNALWTSMGNKNIAVFKVLLKDTKDTNGANSFVKSSNETILMRACEEGRIDIVNELIKAGADVNAKDVEGMTSLMYACAANKNEGRIDIVNELIKAGADVNSRDKKGMTPLMLTRDIGLVDVLIKAGADINAKNNEGMTPLMLARDFGLVDVLIKAGADVNDRNFKGATALALEYELSYGSTGVKNLLKEAGANMQDVYEYFGIKMVPIPGKNFEMLSTEVTQKLYTLVMGKNPSKFKGDNNPVENVSWYDAVQFCNALSRKFGLTEVYKDKYGDDMNASANGFILPTKAEWKHAAKGGTNYTYAGSNKIDDVAWYFGNSDYKTHQTAQKKANGYGLYDMSGNVWEWCQDDGRTDMYGFQTKVVCGGGFGDFDADCCNVTYDTVIRHGNRYNYVGFRVVRNIK